jgi:hypothetical protein
MATSVAEICQRLEQPLLPPDVFSVMAKRLATADEQADHQADTGSDADGFP